MAYSSGGIQPLSAAVGDVNGDGKPDIVVGHPCSDPNHCVVGSVAVLLGSGDGTFQTAVAYSSGELAHKPSVGIADVNEDGKPDLIVTNQCADSACQSGSVGVLLGNGGGAFQVAQTYGSGGEQAYSVAVADVNGDAKPDLVVANQCSIGSTCNSPQIGAVGVLINITPSPYKAFVQPPINADGTSTFSVKRGVVPVKFAFAKDDAPTCALPPATIGVAKISGDTPGAVDENVYSTNADSGSNFRIDPKACQYVYNLGVSSLGVGTYRVDIRINGLVVGHAVFALK